MKANKNILPYTYKTVLLLLLIGFQSCGTYNTKTSDIESNLFSGDFNEAVANIDKNKFLLKDRNRLLYLLEKGKIEHLRGNYEASNILFEEAYILIDDRIKTNMGQAIAAKFTNPMAEPYKGEDFEKVSIHYYKALNYFQLGMPNEALVEAKRINIKLNELNENYKENKNKYSEDAFSQILQGILYESKGELNDAFISYRNAEGIFAKNNNIYFGVPLPEQLKQDLLRTSKQLGFSEEHNAYRKKFGIAPEPAPAKKPAPKKGKANNKKGKKETPAPAPAPAAPVVTGEAVVFWENGLGPAKDEITITASGGSGVFYGTWTDEGVMEEILIPIPPGADLGSINAISIPKYRKREPYYSKATILLNDKEQPFELAQDYYPIAKQCLKDRMLRETIDLVLRFAAKKAASLGLKEGVGALFGDVAGDVAGLAGDAAGAITEKADTRNWQTLPATIGYIRLPLKEGDNKFVIRKYGPMGVDTDTLSIPFKRGLQIVNYFDLGRTQVMPAGGSSLNAIATTSGARPSDQTLAIMGQQARTSQTTGGTSLISAPADVTPQAVIQKYIEACGGEEKIKAVQTIFVKTSGKTMYGGKPILSETVSKSNLNNDCFVQSYTDGKLQMTTVVNETGAYYFDASGKKTKMDKSTFKSIKEVPNFQQGFSAPLFGKEYRLAGITKINNEDAYAISYKANTADVDMTHYYSVKSGLLVATTGSYDIGGEKYTITSYFSDYKDVNGIKYPFKTQMTGKDYSSETVTTEIKFNEGVSPTDFHVN